MTAIAKKRKATTVHALATATRIRDVMTPMVTCVTRDVPVHALTKLLLENAISGVPVVDQNGRPVGVVSKTDLIAQLPSDETVDDVMMPIAFTLRDTDSLAKAARLMAVEHVHRIPITDLDGRVCGIVTAFDVARWIVQS
jgi:CBS domain-containing protein